MKKSGMDYNEEPQETGWPKVSTTLPLIEIDSVELDDTNITIYYFVHPSIARKVIMFRVWDIEEFNSGMNWSKSNMDYIERVAKAFLVQKLNLDWKAENTALKEKLEKATGSLLAISLKVDDMENKLKAFAAVHGWDESLEAEGRTIKEIKDELKKLI